jgi:hypothetical protein
LKLLSLKETIVSAGLFSFLVLTTVSGLVTTYGSQDAIYLIRLIAAVIVSIATAFVVVRLRFSRSVVISVVLYLFVFLYAVAVASITGGLQIIVQSLAIDFIVALCGIVLFGTQLHESTRILPNEFLRLFTLYAIGAFLLTFAFGGFVFELPPRFVFDVFSDELGREENYSLMMTSFFMLAAIFASIGVVRSGLNIHGTIYFVLLLLFLLLSVLGGGRGELAAGLLIIAFVFFRERKVRLISIAAFGALAVVGLVLNSMNVFENVVAVQRFYLLFEGDLSSRDSLFGQVLDLLANRPSCIVFGCGPGFFQRYHGFDFGLYPHNSIAEATVIYGLPLLMVGLAFAANGFVKYYKKVGGLDLFVIYFAYSCLVSLKSGYLFGSWVVVAGVFFFIGVGFERAALSNATGLRSPVKTALR